MKTKKVWANLAVNNLSVTTLFYIALGFKLNISNSEELVSFSFGENDFIINFFMKNIIENNTKMEFSNLENGNEIILSLSAESRVEVDEWVSIVEKAGGKIFAQPYEIGEGYTLGFSDPDGHKFNVLYWPGM